MSGVYKKIPINWLEDCFNKQWNYYNFFVYQSNLRGGSRKKINIYFKNKWFFAYLRKEIYYFGIIKGHRSLKLSVYNQPRLFTRFIGLNRKLPCSNMNRTLLINNIDLNIGHNGLNVGKWYARGAFSRMCNVAMNRISSGVTAIIQNRCGNSN